jgi:lipooligosaccharide transport system permease protein
MFFTGVMPNIETFNLPVFLVITPMFLLSGTFFPLDNLPGWAASLAMAVPLTHLSNLTRSLGLGRLGWDLLASAIYLTAFAAVFYILALWAMRRRLIQ